MNPTLKLKSEINASIETFYKTADFSKAFISSDSGLFFAHELQSEIDPKTLKVLKSELYALWFPKGIFIFIRDYSSEDFSSDDLSKLHLLIEIHDHAYPPRFVDDLTSQTISNYTKNLLKSCQEEKNPHPSTMLESSVVTIQKCFIYLQVRELLLKTTMLVLKPDPKNLGRYLLEKTLVQNEI